MSKINPSQIIQSIKSIVPLNEEEEREILSKVEIRLFKKNEFLLREGQICNKVTFVNSGCMRLFYEVEGTENTIQFFFNGSWYTDYASFLTNRPTIENMQAIQTSELAQISKEDLYFLYDRHQKFDRVGRVLAENAFLSLSQINQMLVNEKPEDRYLKLLNEKPEIVKQIPQHYIASYLGVKPETLSRIRKRIFSSY